MNTLNARSQQNTIPITTKESFFNTVFWQNTIAETFGGIASGLVIGLIFTFIIGKMLQNQDKQGVGGKILRDLKNHLNDYIRTIIRIPAQHGIPCSATIIIPC